MKFLFSYLTHLSLADWQKQIVNLLKNIRKQSDFSSSSAVDFTQELLRFVFFQLIDF